MLDQQTGMVIDVKMECNDIDPDLANEAGASSAWWDQHIDTDGSNELPSSLFEFGSVW